MGYELHIVRQTDYDNDEEESNITLDEWLTYAANDEELELTNGFSTNFPIIEPVWQDAPGFCYWQGHSRADADYIPWFDYGYGSISTKNPDKETIEKMINISLVLNAKVRGDHEEFYDATFFTNGGHPVAELFITDIDKKEAKKTKPWWKFW